MNGIDPSEKATDAAPLSPEEQPLTRSAEFDVDYVNYDHLYAFEKALQAPPANPDALITAESDWRPIRQRVRGRRRRKPRKDETREGFVYTLLKWPLLLLVFGWIILLGFLYFLTRIYIYMYEHWVTWRGERQRLRKKMRGAGNYEEWQTAANKLDEYLGGDEWKEIDEFAYYDHLTLKRVISDMRTLRKKADDDPNDTEAMDALGTLLQACVKHDFAGTESSRLYSQTYFGTKERLQEFKDELERCLRIIIDTQALSQSAKRTIFKTLSKNYGKTALCLSGGACFAYYHLGVIRAHLDAGLIPNIITGTSGGGLVASLLGTRTDDELKQIVVPELASKISACHDDTFTWMKRWWRTGARFDSLDWAERCMWFTRGSMTFKEAYDRTGRILNISCVPSDPNSPSIILNHITAPECVLWSALLASSAVPGILNPIVLMMKTKKGNLIPYSFGHKWKDGSIRTDIPIQALNTHFNVNFPIVSQTNPHVTLFFFSSRGTVGRPVSHRKGRGWRGGFLGSAVEQYLKLDLNKWLKVLRHLELLPRPLGTDWSNLFLQRFYGSVNILPKTKLIDYYYILSDPSKKRLGAMIRSGERATYPKLMFISNHMKIERLIDEGRKATRSKTADLENVLSSEDIAGLLQKKKSTSKSPRMASIRSNRSPFISTVNVDRANSRSPIAKSPLTKTPGANSPIDGGGDGIIESKTPVTSRFSPRNWFSNNSNWSIADVLVQSNDNSRRASTSTHSRRDSQETIRPAVEPLTAADDTSLELDLARKTYFGGVGGEYDTDGIGTESMSEAETTGVEDHTDDDYEEGAYSQDEDLEMIVRKEEYMEDDDGTKMNGVDIHEDEH